MATTFRPCEPDQMLLLAPDMRDWLPEGHFAHHVSDLVDGLDLTAFCAPYEGDGRRNAPYEPRMMVKVLLYGYATEVFSSRAMARKLEEDVAFRVLGAGSFPSHRTLCEFRRRHLGGVQEAVRGGGASGARAGVGAFREAVDRRDEGACEREQAQGDELRPRAGSATRNASGCPKRPMAGSRRSWDSGDSACGVWTRRKGNGIWYVWR